MNHPLQTDTDSNYLKQVIYIAGTVTEESVRGNYHTITLNGTSVLCECTQSYRGKNILVKGIIDEYNGKMEIRALRIRILT